MQSGLVLSSVVALSLVAGSLGYSGGAPTQVCNTLQPGTALNQHGAAQNSTNPYGLSGPSTYTSGTSFQITITGPNLKGFALAATASGSNTPIVVTWTGKPNGTKEISCTGGGKVWTHSSSADKTGLKATVTVTNTATVVFRLTAVQNRTVYWTGFTKTITNGFEVTQMKPGYLLALVFVAIGLMRY